MPLPKIMIILRIGNRYEYNTYQYYKATYNVFPHNYLLIGLVPTNPTSTFNELANCCAAISLTNVMHVLSSVVNCGRSLASTHITTKFGLSFRQITHKSFLLIKEVFSIKNIIKKIRVISFYCIYYTHQNIFVVYRLHLKTCSRSVNP